MSDPTFQEFNLPCPECKEAVTSFVGKHQVGGKVYRRCPCGLFIVYKPVVNSAGGVTLEFVESMRERERGKRP